MGRGEVLYSAINDDNNIPYLKRYDWTGTIVKLAEEQADDWAYSFRHPLQLSHHDVSCTGR